MECRTEKFAMIDYLKFFCSILVLFLHTVDISAISNENIGLKNIFSFLVWAVCPVEVFIIITSIFFWKAVYDYQEKRFISRQYSRKFKYYTSLYIEWSFLYLPNLLLRIISILKESNSFVLVIVLIIKRFLFTGTVGILWYMLGIIYAIVFIRILFRVMRDWWIFLISLLLYMVSLLGGSYYHLLDEYLMIQRLMDGVLLVTGNLYLFRVPVFVMIGYYLNKFDVMHYFAKKKSRQFGLLGIYIICMIFIYIERYICRSYNLGREYPAFIMCLFIPLCLLILTMNCKFKRNTISAFLGESSGIIYFTHWQVKELWELLLPNHISEWMCFLLCIFVGCFICIIMNNLKGGKVLEI